MAIQDAMHNPPEVPHVEEERPAIETFEDLARRVILFAGAAELTEEAVYESCNRAREMEVGAITVRPSDVDLAKNWLSGSPVELHCVTGFPGGSSTTAARLYEARDVLRRGVREVACTMNLGKLLSRKFLYLESELLQLSDSCHQNGARLRLLFEVDALQQDHVLIGVRLAKRTRADTMELCFRGTVAEREIAVARYVAHHARGKVGVAVHAPSIGWAAALEAHEAGAGALVSSGAQSLLGGWREEILRRAEEESRQREISGTQPTSTTPLNGPGNASAEG